MGTYIYDSTVVETAADNPEEFPFLAAILANPLDDRTQLAYADWLDKNADPRGSFLQKFVMAARDPSSPLPTGEEFPLPWRHITGVRPRQLIRHYVLEGFITGSHADRFENLLMRTIRPTLYLVVTPTADKELVSGCTKYGGLPDLPPGVDWPVFSCSVTFYNTPILCAQIRLSDLQNTMAGKELPNQGLLQFFYCPGRAAPVLLHPEEGPYQRPNPPIDPFWEKGCPAHIREHFYPLISGRVRLIEGVDFYIRFDDWELWPEEFYRENSDYLFDMQCLLMPPEIDPGVGLRQLLGNGQEYNSLGDPPGTRRLAVFGASPETPQYWGDSAQPIWYIDPQDLAAQRFDKTEWYYG